MPYQTDLNDEDKAHLQPLINKEASMRERMLNVLNNTLSDDRAQLRAENTNLKEQRSAFEEALRDKAQAWVEEEVIKRLRAKRRLEARRLLCADARRERDGMRSTIIGLCVLLTQDYPGWDVNTGLGRCLARETRQLWKERKSDETT